MSEPLVFKPLAFELPVHLNVQLEGVAVEDDGGKAWITGRVKIHADAFGNNLDTEVPFKTLNSGTVNVPLPVGGASIDITAILKDPHQVCATAKLNWGIFNPSTGEQCVVI